MKLTNYYGEPCDIEPYLEKYRHGNYAEISEWLWNELYHQGDIGTASISWLIQANEIFLNQTSIDWNHLGFIYAVMQSIEEHEFIPCPDWAKNKYRPAAISALQHALSHYPENPTEEQKLSIVCVSCAISKMYKSYSLIEYAWGGYEERLMELDYEKNP
ncbi:hypothetical protein LPB19_03505 [Marinobacter salinisoli]|uniref:DUF309 domain-containing protein n=1 Tax=Marinobacter salinisoli TaxID=2769486 RepID=A0ABX7MT48_9GAMM|nr:hypothetical protein [Marinobacter salinisoli]QSP95496.1 hypothetical protein LPB19_03505 [Marinobacter salinisoli]